MLIMNEIEKNQIQITHQAAVKDIKEALLGKAKQQLNFSNDAYINENIQLQAKEDVLKAYREVLTGMANKHLSRPQTGEIVVDAQQKLQNKLTLIKEELFADLQDNKEEFAQSFDVKTKPLCDSLAGFSPSAINTYKAKLSLHHEQLKNKKTKAHLTANVFDPESFSPDPMNPIDYDYKIDIHNLRLQIKHNLANLKPGEKLHIVVEIPPDRADILKKVAETGFQYRISLVALLLLFFIQIKMINKDDETRTISAIQKLIEKDHIPLQSEDITFSIKSRGNDGKLQTVLEPRPLNSSVMAWKLNKPWQALKNILYPAMGMKKHKDELKENDSYSREQPLSANNNNMPSPSLVC